MKINIKIFHIVLCVSFLIGCKKYTHNYIHGYIKEWESETPIGGATVILQYWDAMSKKSFYAYDSLYADADGRFNFTEGKKLAGSIEYTLGMIFISEAWILIEKSL